MRTTLLLAISACLPLLAQSPPACVSIVDTIGALGPGTTGLMTGTITLTLTYTPVVAGVSIPQGSTDIPITNGALSTCQPSGAQLTATYSVRRTGSAQTGSITSVRYWTIPASGGPYTLYGSPVIETATVPTPSLIFEPSQIAPGMNGNCLTTFGGVSVWGSCGGGGSSQCVQTVSFSSAPNFDFSVCPQQRITLTGSVTPSISNAQYCEVPGGCTITFIQGAGAYTVTWPGSVLGGFQIGTINGKRNSQSYTSIDGSNIYAVTPGILNQ
jgi:hypothetical protein